MIWTLAGALLLPGLAVLTLWNGAGLPPSPARRAVVGAAALAVLVAALADRWRAGSGDRSEGTRAAGATAPLLVAVSSGLLLLAVLWNVAFEQAHRAGVSGHIFRKVFLGYASPLYGRGRVPEAPFEWVAIAIAVGCCAWLFRGRLTRVRPVHLAWAAGAVQLLLAVAIGFSESWERGLGFGPGHATFAGYAEAFDSPAAVLDRWVETISSLQGFARHYPPGIPYLYALLSPPVAGVLFALMPTLALAPLLAIARELELDDDASRAIVLVYASSPTLSIFPTLHATPALMLPAAASAWLLLRALRRGSPVAAVGLGLVMAFFSLCSFAAYLVVLPLGCLVAAGVASGRVSLASAAGIGAASLATFALCFGLIDVFAGFPLLEGLAEANRITLAWVPYFPNATAFSLRAVGSVLVYALTAGPAIAALAPAALLTLRGAPTTGWVGPFCVAMVAGFVLGAATGRSYLEAERVYMLYSPLLAVPAGWELGRRAAGAAGRPVAAAIAMALGWTVLYGLWVRHHFS